MAHACACTQIEKNRKSLLLASIFFPCSFCQSPSLRCEIVEETYILQELKWVSKVVSTFIIHICVWQLS